MKRKPIRFPERAATLVLVDRLVSVRPIALSTLPRYTAGVSIPAWLEVATAQAGAVNVVTLRSYRP